MQDREDEKCNTSPQAEGKKAGDDEDGDHVPPIHGAPRFEDLFSRLQILRTKRIGICFLIPVTQTEERRSSKFQTQGLRPPWPAISDPGVTSLKKGAKDPPRLNGSCGWCGFESHPGFGEFWVRREFDPPTLHLESVMFNPSSNLREIPFPPFFEEELGDFVFPDDEGDGYTDDEPLEDLELA